MAQRLPDGRYRGKYRPTTGATQISKVFDTEKEARAWEKQQKAEVTLGQHVDPAAEKMTVAAWGETWLESYSGNRERTVRQAKIHIALIGKEFGRKPIRSIKPIHVQTWTAKLKAEGYQDSTIYAVYRRLSRILAAAVHNDVLDKSPCSRQIAPRGGRQMPYVATRAQIDAIYAAPEHLRPAVLLGAFAGAADGGGGRPADRSRALPAPVHRPAAPERWGGVEVEDERDADPDRRGVSPRPVGRRGAVGRGVRGDRWPGWSYVDVAIERAMRRVRQVVPGLTESFVFHDLRHFFASALIQAGFDVKRVQALLRHASATTTLNTYGHLFPDQDDVVRVELGVLYTGRSAVEGLVQLRQAESGLRQL